MLRLRTFGSVDLEGPDGQDLRPVLAQPKRLALLIYLTTARPAGVHRRDDLLARFWPDLDNSRARDALNQALRFLRQSLGPETFVRRGGEDVGVDPERLWCDAVAFREALAAGRPAEALELYRGEFLKGFFVEEGGGFEEWMEGERVAFREAAARGARDLAEDQAAEGAFTQAIVWGKRALELAPDDERALRRLLRWYDRAGDRAGAFRAYEGFARRFREEFGSDPSPETRALIDRLRSGQPLAEEPGREAPPAAVSSRPTSRDPLLALGDRYQIVRKLGAGGMATVYLARDVKHDREVALKVLRPEIAEGLARERFIREIRIAGRLQHPNIVPMFDSGEADGRLFYVMPHVQGETLRDKLRREGRLPVEEAVHLVREVAGALAYAHEQGVVHRDIKPENILLIDRRAVLADFGIAHAAHAARTPGDGFDATLTQPGTSLGTPAYMAPEQAVGSGEVDQRADLYALGVVTYEMLAGRTPFTGATAHEILAAQLTEVPVPIEERRSEVPPGVAATVMWCLARKPDDRPSSSLDVLQGLLAGANGAPPRRSVETLPPERRRTRARRWTSAGIGILAIVSIAVVLWRSGWLRGRGASPFAPRAVDTTLYVVLPFAREDRAMPGAGLEHSVQDALARWQGIHLIDRFRLDEVVGHRDPVSFGDEAARTIASRLGAGRYLRGELSAVADSLRVRVSLHDATTGGILGDTTVRVARTLEGADSTVAALADRLLLRGAGPGLGATGVPATRSLPARQAFVAGQSAIRRWELQQADSAFSVAVKLDPAYGPAYLWLAQVRNWRSAPPFQWAFAANRAATDSARLDDLEKPLSIALSAAARGDRPAACATLRQLAKRRPREFAAWYGMATCLAHDSVVVRDVRSPSKWSFRSSYAEALTAYLQAFDLLPPIQKSLRSRMYEPIRALLKTSVQFPRFGVSLSSDTTRFLAYPSWDGDTIAFVPEPLSEFRRAGARVIPRTVGQAIWQQRQLFRRIAAGWLAHAPGDPSALEAYSVSLQLLSDPAGIDTLRRAREQTGDPAEQLRLAIAEVWGRLKFAIPGDVASIRGARVLADSLLSGHGDGRAQPERVLSLAVLTGRGAIAARLARSISPDLFWGVPPRIGRVAAPFLVYAGLGGPPDSLETMLEQVQSGISRLPGSHEKSSAYAQWIVRPATLAYPSYRLQGFASINPEGDYLLEAQQAIERHDSLAVRRILEGVRQERQDLPADGTSLDTAYPEASLFAALGDDSSAAQWIDPVLAGLPQTDPQIDTDPAAVAALVRAMVFRADLAARVGDRRLARRWASVVSLLWSDADPFLRPVLDRMHRYMTGTT